MVITPYIVEPTEGPPQLPTGEPAEWDRPQMFNDTMIRPGSGLQIVPPPGGE